VDGTFLAGVICNQLSNDSWEEWSEHCRNLQSPVHTVMSQDYNAPLNTVKDPMKSVIRQSTVETSTVETVPVSHGRTHAIWKSMYLVNLGAFEKEW
jgi:hypothetical protein